MTALRCERCGQWWSMHHRSPEVFDVISRLCPVCVGSLPLLSLRETPEERIA